MNGRVWCFTVWTQPSLRSSWTSRKLQILLYPFKSLNAVSSHSSFLWCCASVSIRSPDRGHAVQACGSDWGSGTWGQLESCRHAAEGNKYVTHMCATDEANAQEIWVFKSRSYGAVAKDPSSSSLSSSYLLGLVDVFALHSGYVTMAGFATHTCVFMC